MRRAFVLCALAALALPSHAFAQGAPQTVELAKVDMIKVGTGYRASKVIGATIYNGANEAVGKIDDIIVAQDGKAPFAVISVGGFLGMGDRLVILPYEQFRTDGERLVLSGATKDALKNLPEFKYASR